MSQKNKRIFFGIFLTLLVICTVFLVLLAVKIAGTKEDELSIDASRFQAEDSISTESSESETTETEIIETEEPIEKIYEKPSYNFKTEKITVKIPNLARSYKLIWVSDLHMIAGPDDPDISDEFKDTVKERYDGLSITSDGTHAVELWPEIVRFINYGYYDGVIFGGDMLDYCSKENIEILKKGLDDIRYPYLYIRSDHDYGVTYTETNVSQQDAYDLHASIDKDTWEDKYLDLYGFQVIGINSSYKNIAAENLPIIKEMYEKGKPVIAATHVPYQSYTDSSLETLSMEVRKKPYYWGAGSYIPDEYTNEYFKYIYSEDSIVEQVVSGHMHASWDGQLTDRVSQHIFTPAFSGSIGIIEVVPE